MPYEILVLGASYGSLLGTKLLMAGYNVTLVCRKTTADLINTKGTDVRLKLRDESDHRSFFSGDLNGQLNALSPDEVDVGKYDLVALAMAEPQYGSTEIRALLKDIAAARLPCLSIMNMPPLPYLHRIPGLDAEALRPAFTAPGVWDDFEPGVVTLCSPDPQAYRLPEEEANVLFVGLPTNFKSAVFAEDSHNEILRQLEADVAGVRIDGKDVPVKLRSYDSLFVPFAKWSMLLTGNYRCVTKTGVRPIKDAVHGNLEASREIYERVDQIARKLGADPADQVPFEKYAAAAEGLLKPSSVARSIAGGATQVERVDRLVQLIADQIGLGSKLIDDVATTVDGRVDQNRRAA